MKTTITLLVVAAFSLGLNAQWALPVGFENPEEDTAWTQFANSGDAPENFVLADNPETDGINTSAKCLNFIVQETADPWVGAWSDAYGPIEFTEENYILSMMVHKDVVTDCGLKVEETGLDPVEVKVPNTVTDTWELLIFDFTAAIGNSWTRLVFFPDFPDPRDGVGSNCYIDNIDWAEGEDPGSIRNINGKYLSVYPNPATNQITVQYPGVNSISIANIAGQTILTVTSESHYIEEINISDLQQGLYIVNLETIDGTVSTKFIKR